MYVDHGLMVLTLDDSVYQPAVGKDPQRMERVVELQGGNDSKVLEGIKHQTHFFWTWSGQRSQSGLESDLMLNF